MLSIIILATLNVGLLAEFFYLWRVCQFLNLIFNNGPFFPKFHIVTTIVNGPWVNNSLDTSVWTAEITEFIAFLLSSFEMVSFSYFRIRFQMSKEQQRLLCIWLYSLLTRIKGDLKVVKYLTLPSSKKEKKRDHIFGPSLTHLESKTIYDFVLVGDQKCSKFHFCKINKKRFF